MVTIYRNTLHSAHMIKTFVQEVLPLVDRELDMWKSYVQTKMSGELQKQALASIASAEALIAWACQLFLPFSKINFNPSRKISKNDKSPKRPVSPKARK